MTFKHNDLDIDRYTKEDCIKVGKEYYEQRDEVPTAIRWKKHGIKPTQIVIYKLFITWDNFLKACNIKRVYKTKRKRRKRGDYTQKAPYTRPQEVIDSTETHKKYRREGKL